MSRKTQKSKRESATKQIPTKHSNKFRIFVKPVDEFGYPDESRFGWISYKDNEIVLMLLQENSIVFEEKESGHGSFEDWKKFFEEDRPDWRILNGPSYLPLNDNSEKD